MKSRKILIFIAVVMVISIIGVTYAFFRYYMIGSDQKITSGEVSLVFDEGEDTIGLTNIFPETKEEARARVDNQITFTVSGVNTTTNKDLYYEIMLNEGKDKDGKTRFEPSDLVFDLIEVAEDGTETYVVDAMTYANFNKTRIWADVIEQSTQSKITKTYKLRMWLSEDVIISDTDEDADYSTAVFKNSYANVKVIVYGDFYEKNIPLTVENNDMYIENNKSYFIARISNYINESQLDESSNDNMKFIVTSSNSNVLFSYKDSEGNVVTDTSKTLEVSYLFTKKKAVELQVFVTTINDANAETELNFKLMQNNEVVQDYYEKFTVVGNNFCLNNGLNKLYDCILASDSLATNVETAKVNIMNKGEPNLKDTAPTYTYVEEETLDLTDLYFEKGYKYVLADSYTFNPTTGSFALINTVGSNIIIDDLSDKYKNYYTCGNINYGYLNCSSIFRIKETSNDGETQYISLGDKITYKLTSTIRSEVGLYKTEDDYGDSYVYRGDVTNNNVLFGGYYWKIIRTNGDNSIRLIYSGETSNATGKYTSINNTYYPFSDTVTLGNNQTILYSGNPNYLGYMYGDNMTLKTGAEVSFTNFASTTKYYFADSYEVDEENRVFKLTTKEREPILKTLSEMNTIDEETGKYLYELYPYTRRRTSLDDYGVMVHKINSITSATSAKIQYISYVSSSYDDTKTNELSSNAKIQLENWYRNNLVGKKDENGTLITDYIVDGTFCNNRSISKSYSGYLIDKTTIYASYTRIGTNKSADLKCSVDSAGNADKRDWFSDTTSKGNGLLEYPVALITADEVVLAGGKNETRNQKYYLNTTGLFYTMTPSVYDSSTTIAALYFVYENGGLKGSGASNSISRGLRPVINLSSDVLISSGDGTTENPFILSLS